MMDNATYHKSAPSLAALSLFEHHILVIGLPTYCSELNPIECYWHTLKDLAWSYKLQDNNNEVVRSVESILIDQNTLEFASRYHVSRKL